MLDILPYRPALESQSVEDRQDDVSFMLIAAGFGAISSVVAIVIAVMVWRDELRCSQVLIIGMTMVLLVFCIAGIIQGMIELCGQAGHRRMGAWVLGINLLPFLITGLLEMRLLI